MFHRRHVFEHRAGVADQRYLDESGDDSVALGQAIRETPDNVRRFGDLLLAIVRNFDEGFHSIFPPDEKALASLRGRAARRRKR